jgi:hypothetical protein
MNLQTCRDCRDMWCLLQRSCEQPGRHKGLQQQAGTCNICIYIYIYTYRYIYTYIYTRTDKYRYDVYVHIYTPMMHDHATYIAWQGTIVHAITTNRTFVYVYIYIHTHTHTYTYILMNTYAYEQIYDIGRKQDPSGGSAILEAMVEVRG